MPITCHIRCEIILGERANWFITIHHGSTDYILDEYHARALLERMEKFRNACSPAGQELRATLREALNLKQTTQKERGRPRPQQHTK